MKNKLDLVIIAAAVLLGATFGFKSWQSYEKAKPIENSYAESLIYDQDQFKALFDAEQVFLNKKSADFRERAIILFCFSVGCFYLANRKYNSLNERKNN